MRRGSLIGAVLIAISVVALALALQSHTPERFTVDAQFDSAKGMVPGQLVKIAGASVGKVNAVRLAPGPSAVMSLSVDRRFAPFHADASCQILPEGPISEYFVSCDPGHARSGLLAANAEGVPVVLRSQTRVPVSLQDFLNIFSVPVSQRIRVLVNELGIATAGRGEDINAILRRANPALAGTRRVLNIADAQIDTLTAAVRDTGDVVGKLAADRRSVRALVGRSADLLAVTASHRRQLAQGVKGLPKTLSSTRGGLRSLDRIAKAATPLLRDLRKAGPSLTSATGSISAFTSVATPAVKDLGATSRVGLRAIGPTSAAVRQLGTLARKIKPVAPLLTNLLESLRDTGGVDGAVRWIYAMATVAAGYDSVSHMTALLVTAYPRCILAPNSPGCSHDFAANSLAVNAPQLGPQTDMWPAPPRGAVTAAPTGANAKASPADIRKLLDFLLK
jgi:phospholipid/cholesterol/gamma-HCH transport system substrate-binding protein